MDSLVMVVALGAAVAGFVQGLSGFAYGLVAMSFWAWTLEPRLAASLALFGSLTGQVIAAVTVRRGFDLKSLLPFVLGGLGGFTGALPTLWCTLRGLEKDAQRAIVQNFNLSMLLVTMGSYLASGIVTRSMLPMFGVVAVAMLVPVLLGARLYIGISEAAFRKIVLGLLTASGAAMLVASVPTLLARIAV